jgi:hypothetical protein
VRLLVIMVGLTAIVTGIGGVFANLFYGKGSIALYGMGISMATLCLGLILIYMGLREEWSH